MRKLLDRWRQEGVFSEDGSLPEAPDITIISESPRKPRSLDQPINSVRQEQPATATAISEGVSWDPTTKSGTYLYVAHGPPESQSAEAWAAAGRKAIAEINHCKNSKTANRLFTDACYFFNSVRYLREKSDTEKGRFFYLLENMKYAEELQKKGGGSN